MTYCIYDMTFEDKFIRTDCSTLESAKNVMIAYIRMNQSAGEQTDKFWVRLLEIENRKLIGIYILGNKMSFLLNFDCGYKNRSLALQSYQREVDKYL